MSVRINIDQVADEIMSKLEDYRDLAADIVKAAVKDVAEESVYDMQESIERAGIGGTGAYKSSIDQKKNTVKGAYGHVVYARAPHYRLTHLLEIGHDIKNQPGGPVLGRVKAYPHWERVRNSAVQKLTDRILRGLSLLRGG